MYIQLLISDIYIYMYVDAVAEEISRPKAKATQGFRISREAFHWDDDFSHGSSH